MNAGNPAMRAVHAVDIVCAVFNGASFLSAFLQSVQAQSHANWRLWIRDDGSTDSSVAIATSWAVADARIRLVETDNNHLGAVGSFALLLERLPRDAGYVMFADQDDVWLPHKIAATLSAMIATEQRAPGPVLVHTDLVVVDEALNEIDPSFWRFANINPDPPSLRRLIGRNVVTGATAMLNRVLLEHVGVIPPGAAMHDWWVACTACAFGRVVALHDTTVLYRQHGANAIGARRPASTLAWHEIPGALGAAFKRTATVREDITAAALQAGTFLARYRDSLVVADRRFLAAYARIPERHCVRRKFDVARLHLSAENGFIQNLGVLLRA